MQQSIPRIIEDNPSLPDGLYEALIQDIRLRRSSQETHIYLFLRLPNEQMNFFTGLRAPKTSYNRQDHRHLMDFCSAINVDIRFLLNKPSKLKGRQLRIRTRRDYYDADGTTHWFSTIVSFIPFGTDLQRKKELGMPMVLR